MKKNKWPELPLKEWEETYDLLHLISQIIGKIKLQFNPYKNHWWNISLLPSVKGLTTGIIPCGNRTIAITMNFVNHSIDIRSEDGKHATISLRTGTVADYYKAIKMELEKMNVTVKIWTVPVEVEDRTPFEQDNRQREYKKEYAERFHTILLDIAGVMEDFRGKFTGKASPVHFFWGAFDMALTFFNGKDAPEHPGAPNVGKEVMVRSYNKELASFGWWPGKGLGEAAFYAYSYPVLDGFKNYNIQPEAAYYHKDLGEFVLPYAAVAKAADPKQELSKFLWSSYEAVEEFGKWDKKLRIDH